MLVIGLHILAAALVWMKFRIDLLDFVLVLFEDLVHKVVGGLCNELCVD